MKDINEGFYKIDGDEILYAPNFVYSKDFEIEINNKEKYTYPIHGWYYFETEESAMKFFDVKEAKEIKVEEETNRGVEILVEKEKVQRGYSKKIESVSNKGKT